MNRVGEALANALTRKPKAPAKADNDTEIEPDVEDAGEEVVAPVKKGKADVVEEAPKKKKAEADTAEEEPKKKKAKADTAVEDEPKKKKTKADTVEEEPKKKKKSKEADAKESKKGRRGRPPLSQKSTDPEAAAKREAAKAAKEELYKDLKSEALLKTSDRNYERIAMLAGITRMMNKDKICIRSKCITRELVKNMLVQPAIALMEQEGVRTLNAKMILYIAKRNGLNIYWPIEESKKKNKDKKAKKADGAAKEAVAA